MDKEDTGLYRDDGLVIVRNLTGPQTDKQILIFSSLTCVNSFANEMALSSIVFVIVG